MIELAAALAVAALVLVLGVLEKRYWQGRLQAMEDRLEKEREAWREERRQLLDRVQAGGLAEYRYFAERRNPRVSRPMGRMWDEEDALTEAGEEV